MRTKSIGAFQRLHLKHVHLTPGTYLNAGTSTFGLISDDQRWVLLDLKSHSFVIFMLGIMRPSAFACFQAVFCMALSPSIGPGVNRQQSSSSVSTSALPYLEQTEDWVELNQRFPVRIMIDKKDLKQHRLIPVGSSASVVIARSH